MRRIRRFKSIAALVLLGVILSYTLVKTFHHHEDSDVLQFQEGISDKGTSCCYICTYFLSAFSHSDSDVLIYEFLVIAFLLFPGTLEKAAELSRFFSLRAPPSILESTLPSAHIFAL